MSYHDAPFTRSRCRRNDDDLWHLQMLGYRNDVRVGASRRQQDLLLSVRHRNNLNVAEDICLLRSAFGSNASSSYLCKAPIFLPRLRRGAKTGNCCSYLLSTCIYPSHAWSFEFDNGLAFPNSSLCSRICAGWDTRLLHSSCDAFRQFQRKRRKLFVLHHLRRR